MDAANKNNKKRCVEPTTNNNTVKSTSDRWQQINIIVPLNDGEIVQRDNTDILTTMLTLTTTKNSRRQ